MAKMTQSDKLGWREYNHEINDPKILRIKKLSENEVHFPTVPT